MSDTDLLAVLADGQFHSGSELGEVLGVSRSAVWKHIHKWQQNGLEIYSVKGRGYRIPGGLDLLDPAEIRRLLSSQAEQQLSRIDLQLLTGSTNQSAMEQCQQQDCHGKLFLAEQQSAGRGRRGRRWISPFARNLYFSFVWRFEQGAAALEGLSLVVGLALLRAVEVCGCEGVRLKWPNDLLCEGQKLAGILLELNGEASGECQVVIGIGLNVAMTFDEAEQVDQPWTSVTKLSQQKISRNQIVAELVNQLVPALEKFSLQGFESFRAEWNEYNAHQGREITLEIGQQQISGLCRGVDSSGALLLEQNGKMSTYHGGEVSIKKYEDC